MPPLFLCPCVSVCERSRSFRSPITKISLSSFGPSILSLFSFSPLAMPHGPMREEEEEEGGGSGGITEPEEEEEEERGRRMAVS